jgi:hypothetical protein
MAFVRIGDDRSAERALNGPSEVRFTKRFLNGHRSRPERPEASFRPYRRSANDVMIDRTFLKMRRFLYRAVCL